MPLKKTQSDLLTSIYEGHENHGAMTHHPSLSDKDQATANELVLLGMIERHRPALDFVKPTPLGRQTATQMTTRKQRTARRTAKAK